MPEEPAVVHPDPASHRTRRSRHWPILVGLVAMLVVVGGVVVAVRSRSSSSYVPSALHYVEEAAAAGIDHQYAGGSQFFVGGGVAAFDCNEDGRPDLFFAGGSGPAALYRNESPTGGALRFARVASSVTDLTSVTGAYPLDIDGDGHLDLAVLRVGGNVVLRGRGNCQFERANERFGIDGGNAWTVAFSATWEGSNALPTLAFGNYRTPDGESCADSELVRPAASGDTYAAAIPLHPGYCTLSVLFSDWSRTGKRDLRMTNDRNYYREGEEQLWRLEPGQAPRLYTAGEGWRPMQIWGMGIASQDVTGDGYPEVFLTSQGDNKLQTLAAGATRPSYADIALDRGVTAQRPFTGGDVLPSTAWHPEFEDVNNDGVLDLFVSKGNVEAQPDYARRDPSNLFLGEADGTFVEGAEAAGIVRYERARGASLVDLNLDGMLDLVVVDRAANVQVWRNVGRGDAAHPAPMGHWIAVGLQQPAPDVDAIGAWLDVKVDGRTVTREVTVGGGHAGGKLGWFHFGLGDAKEAQVRVTWPDGQKGSWMTMQADQMATIERGSPAPARWLPPPAP
ncbi:MAG TPA: CRTAC1 family protein [Nocardioidaceae bacterium]